MGRPAEALQCDRCNAMTMKAPQALEVDVFNRMFVGPMQPDPEAAAKRVPDNPQSRAIDEAARQRDDNASDAWMPIELTDNVGCGCERANIQQHSVALGFGGQRVGREHRDDIESATHIQIARRAQGLHLGGRRLRAHRLVTP